MATIDARGEQESSSSLGDLFSRMTTDLSTLVRKEFELAKVETKEEIGRASKAGGKLGGAAFAAYLAIVLASFALVFLLDEIMHVALAFFLVAAVYGIVAAVLASMGRDDMKRVNPVPEQTVETIKEDVEWAKARRS